MSTEKLYTQATAKNCTDEDAIESRKKKLHTSEEISSPEKSKKPDDLYFNNVINALIKEYQTVLQSMPSWDDEISHTLSQECDRNIKQIENEIKYSLMNYRTQAWHWLDDIIAHIDIKTVNLKWKDGKLQNASYTIDGKSYTIQQGSGLAKMVQTWCVFHSTSADYQQKQTLNNTIDGKLWIGSKNAIIALQNKQYTDMKSRQNKEYTDMKSRQNKEYTDMRISSQKIEEKNNNLSDMITTAIVDACTTCNNGNGYFKEVKITRDDQNNIVAEFESITSNKGKFLLHIKTDASGDKYNTLEFMDQQGYYTPVYGTSLNMKQNDVSGNYITTGKFKTDLIDTIQYLQQMNEVLNKVSSDTPRNSQGNFFYNYKSTFNSSQNGIRLWEDTIFGRSTMVLPSWDYKAGNATNIVKFLNDAADKMYPKGTTSWRVE